MEVDVVCGMEVSSLEVTVVIEGRSFCFCSEGCRAEFIRHTDEYLFLLDSAENQADESKETDV